MKVAAFGRSAVKRWFGTRWQGPFLLQLCVYGIVGIVLAVFLASYPAGLPEWRFFGAVAALAALLALNLFWINPIATASPKLRSLKEWSFLSLSAMLVLATVWLSGESSMVYLLSIVCGQATFKRGAWPAGIAFGAASLAAWLALQIAVGSSIYAIFGTETALASGILFVLLLTTLLKRYALQTRRAESLLEELHAAHRELEAAHQKEKELAVAEERVRLARDLHDSVTQLLYSVTLYAEAAAELLSSGQTARASSHLGELGDTAREALRVMRLLIFELHRPTLECGGLAGALQARLDAVEARGGIHAELTTEGAGHLEPAVEAELYSIAQEALNNVLKHARAKEVRVRLQFRDERADLEVSDDGVGFRPAENRRGGGFGIAGMRERAAKIGGTLRIESAPGGGTRIAVRLPLSSSERTKQGETEQ